MFETGCAGLFVPGDGGTQEFITDVVCTAAYRVKALIHGWPGPKVLPLPPHSQYPIRIDICTHHRSMGLKSLGQLGLAGTLSLWSLNQVYKRTKTNMPAFRHYSVGCHSVFWGFPRWEVWRKHLSRLPSLAHLLLPFQLTVTWLSPFRLVT